MCTARDDLDALRLADRKVVVVDRGEVDAEDAHRKRRAARRPRGLGREAQHFRGDVPARPELLRVGVGPRVVVRADGLRLWRDRRFGSAVEARPRAEGRPLQDAGLRCR